MSSPPDSLAEAVVLAFDTPVGTDGPPLTLDPHGRIRRLQPAGRSLVAKRCPTVAGLRERQLALDVRDRVSLLPLPIAVSVVVPQVVPFSDSECALVTPDLGEPLSTNSTEAERLIRPDVLLVILGALVGAGIEAPGFVPRNLFWTVGRLWAIDWEDAHIGPAPAAPDDLTLAKWDIAWSDVYQRDPRLRDRFSASTSPRPLDRFERALDRLFVYPMIDVEVCRAGVRMTLASELHVPGTLGGSAAELGHLAYEVLDVRHSVLHTALTAHIREAAGDEAYTSVLNSIWLAAEPLIEEARQGLAADDQLTAVWLRELCLAADRALTIGGGPTIEVIAADLNGLAGRTGWTAGCERARLAELLLAGVVDLVAHALDADDLELLLRGSLSHGVLSINSDLDFELSCPTWPNGHRDLEQLVIDVLASFGLGAEGSAGRPTEVDIRDLATGLTRDLHEWMELRRPTSSRHDPGWLREYLTPDLAALIEAPSQYEAAGRQETAKFLWFETRAALARSIFRQEGPRPPVTLVEQIAILPSLVGHGSATELADTVLVSFALREGSISKEWAVVGDRLNRIRTTLRLPGPRCVAAPARSAIDRTTIKRERSPERPTGRIR